MAIRYNTAESKRVVRKSLKKDTKSRDLVLRLIEEQGATVSLNRGHMYVYHPNGVGMVRSGTTPGDHRTWRNFRAMLRRAGFDV
jgi:hypothetical protein